MLRAPADLFPLRFGDHSYAPHLAAAQIMGPVVQLRLPGLALDIDRPDDVQLLMEAPGETRAQKALRGWNVADRLRALAARS